MRQIMVNNRRGEDELINAGDLRGLFAILDEPAKPALVGDGLRRLLSSIAMTQSRPMAGR